MDKYLFLFPFEKIKYGSRIIIYGAGDVGCDYLKQMIITNYCTCVAILDRNAANIAPLVVPVYTPDSLPKFEYDYILLAFKDGANVQSVTNTLLHFGADKDKIIFNPIRSAVEILAQNSASQEEHQYSFFSDNISIGIKIGPSLGDSIIKKKIIMEIASMAPGCMVDLYAAGSSKFMSAIYDDKTPCLNSIIDDGGVLFEHNKNNYDIAIELYSILEVKHISDKLAKKNKTFYDKMLTLSDVLKEYNLPVNPITNVFVHFQRMRYRGLNVYNYLNFTGIFSIKDKNVEIILDDSYLHQYKQLNLGNYVTVNYGTANVSTHGDNIISKQWPFGKLCEFVQLFKRKYPNIKIVQLGTKAAPKVDGVNVCAFGQNLELVKHILNGSLLHIDSEGGLVHLATQLGTKCIVLFGPTPIEYYGYEQNDNIRVGACSSCYMLYDAIDKCARNMKRPECMDSITPKLVMEHVDKYFSGENISGSL